jgi:hypothetical protein
MARPRRPIFVGEWIDETPKRGHSTDIDKKHESEWRQHCAVRDMIARRLLGESLNEAKEHTAELIELAGEWKREEDALRDLYRANVRDAIYEVALDLVINKKLLGEDAISRTETILAELDKRSNAQQMKRKNRKS